MRNRKSGETSSATGNFSKDFGLKDQTRRAAVSIMANIAEGHGRRTNVEFANFLNFARPEQVTLVPVDMRVLAESVVADLRGEVPAGTALSVTGAFGRVLLRCDQPCVSGSIEIRQARGEALGGPAR